MDQLPNKKCAQVAWTYLDCHEYKFENISLLVSQVAWTYCQIKSVLRLHGPIWTVMSINFENISLLVSHCMDLLPNKKCAQVAWTYLDCHEYKFGNISL